ncbi:hypothetical protein [Streptomyces toxytricini]|uniref:hypothetical protein n=1 Tax=Streptomyces toxytricini TaxID=67369 RepID=UPI0034384E92
MTSDAREELDRVWEGVEREILIKARLLADRTGSKIVSGADVAIAAKEVLEGSAADYFRLRKTTFLRAVAVALGVSAGVFAVLIVAQEGAWAQAVTQLSAGGATLAGATIGLLLSRVASRKRATNSRAESYRGFKAHSVIVTWAEIEREIRSRLVESGGGDEMRRPLGALIGEYADVYGLDPSFIERVRKVLDARNKIAHGVGGEFSVIELEGILAAARTIRDEIRGHTRS